MAWNVTIQCSLRRESWFWWMLESSWHEVVHLHAKYAIFGFLIYLKLWKMKVHRVLLESWRNQLRLFIVTVITKKTLAFSTRPLSSPHLTSQGEVISGADSRTFYWIIVIVVRACTEGTSHLAFYSLFNCSSLHCVDVVKVLECSHVTLPLISLSFLTLWVLFFLWNWGCVL